jgi:hypothetical protein
MNTKMKMTAMFSEIITLNLKHEAKEEGEKRLVTIEDAEYIHNRYHYSDQIGWKEYELMSRKLLEAAVDEHNFTEDTPKIPPMIQQLFEWMDDGDEFITDISFSEPDWIITNLYVKRKAEHSPIIEIQIEFEKQVSHTCMLCDESVPEHSCLVNSYGSYMCEDCHSDFSSC